jgi:hypothetical protein
MSEPPDQYLPAPTGPPGDASVERIDDRLVKAAPEDVVLWTQVRGEVVKQEEYRSQQAHRRSIEKTELYAKVGLSIGASGVGVFLIGTAHLAPGMLALGAGLFWLARPFVMKFFSPPSGGADDAAN